MRKSGRTPLLRARNLEKKLNVGEIYLKLEGTNPSGHKNDRISEVFVKDALAAGYEEILVDGSEEYIRSVMFFSDLEDIKVSIPIYKHEKWKTSRFPSASLIDFKAKTGLRSLSQLRKYATTNKLYFICEWDYNPIVSDLILEQMTHECLERMNYNVDTITTQIDFGITVSSVYRSLAKNWINNLLTQFPKLYVGTKQDMIDKMTTQIMGDGDYSFTQADHSFNRSVLQLRDNDEIYDPITKIISYTGADVVAVDEESLKKSVSMLYKIENVIVSKKAAYPMSAFMDKCEKGLIGKGRHLIILNDARSAVEVKEVKNADEKRIKELVALTRSWLVPYDDSVEETTDAIDKALREGFVMVATRNGEEQGICVVVNMGFTEFIPTYHLGYIGVKAGNKGRGMATELMKRAIDLTDGKLSLHVDLDNAGAKKLYRKMGFKHCYDRMIYQNPSEE